MRLYKSVCYCTSSSCHQLYHLAESRILSLAPSGFDSHMLLFERAVYIACCPQEVVGRVDMLLLHFTWLGRQCKGHVVVTGGAKSIECSAARKERRGKADAQSMTCKCKFSFEECSILFAAWCRKGERGRKGEREKCCRISRLVV